MDNLYLYKKYAEVPKEALKPFDNGKFKGTDINTMWRIKCLTEEFGVCGIGWYPEVVRTWTENGANDEVLCFAEINLYIKVNGEWSKGISATGGSTLIQFVKSGQYHKSNDEGFKMAITDALGVACKLLGFGANTYWEHGRSKYTAEETEQPKQAQKTAQNRTEEKKEVNSFKPLTREEILRFYGVRQVEQTIEWLEGKIGAVMANWNEEQTAWARGKLEAKKKQREEEERQAQLSMVGDADIPFPMAGEYVEG